jgi:hypothetical protein
VVLTGHLNQFLRLGKLGKRAEPAQITDQGRPDISSRKTDLVKNSNCSVDIYFGPKAPQGKEANWVQTNSGKGWFAYFRFYGPTEPFFDKSWALPDVEKIG